MIIWLAKLKNLFAGERRLADELREEMAAHLEFEVEDQVARGLRAAEADSAARRRFGNSASIAEKARDAWCFSWLDGLLRDVRVALRSIRRRPGFTAVAVVSLAVALGANTAVFSFANPILLRRLPVAGADRLVVLGQRNEQFHMENCCFSYPLFRELRKAKSPFDGFLAVSSLEATLAARGNSQSLR